MLLVNFELTKQFGDNWLQLFYQFVGVITTLLISLIVVIRVLVFIYNDIFSGFKWRGGPNMWAVVTGGTDGIGLEYAKQLYQKNYNLLLISRNPQKLEEVKQEIHQLYGNDRNIRILAIDFTQSSDDIYDKIETEFETLGEIHVLVNSVGTIGYPDGCPEYFTEIPNVKEVIMTLININIVPCTRLIALVLPRMEAKGRGAIINLSSLSAKFPVPLLTIYAATKSYVDYMSRSLQEEYRRKGITIQSLLTATVSTKMNNYIKPGFFTPLPETYVNHTIKTVGRVNCTSGYITHQLWHLFASFMGLLSNLIGIDLSARFTHINSKGIRDRMKAKKDQTHTFDGHLKRTISNLDKLN